MAFTSIPLLLVSVNCSTARPSTVPKASRFTSGPAGVVLVGASTVRGPLQATPNMSNTIAAGTIRLKPDATGVIGAVGYHPSRVSLQFDGIQKSFGATNALRGVS